jgi:hypothetical protein
LEDDVAYSIDTMIKEVEREIIMREHLYPRQVGRGKTYATWSVATMHIDIMRDVVKKLEQVRDREAAATVPLGRQGAA